MIGSGHFNDGRTARRLPVSIKIVGNALHIADAAGVPLAAWPLAEIRFADAGHQAPPIRLKLSGGTERLTLEGDGAFLLTQCPNLVLRRTATAGIGWRRWGIAGTLAALSVVGILWLLIPAAAGWAVSLVPKQAEERLGLATRDQIVDLIGKIGICDCAIALQNF